MSTGQPDILGSRVDTEARPAHYVSKNTLGSAHCENVSSESGLNLRAQVVECYDTLLGSPWALEELP